MGYRRSPLVKRIRVGATVGLLSLAGLFTVFVGVVYRQHQTEVEAQAEVQAAGLEYVSTQLVAGITWSNTERIQDFVLTSTGKPRLVYADSATNALHYGSCDTDCDSLGNWTFVQIFSGIDTRIEPALALDSSNNPRVIYKNHYLFCDTSCTSALNWTAVNVGFGTSNDFNSLAITTDGKPRFVFGNNNDPGSVLKYAQCDTTCSNPANWTIITADSTLGSGFFSSVVLTTDNKVRVAHTANISGSVNGVSMSFCDTSCDLLVNWNTVVIDPGPITTQYTTIALNSSDNPRIFTGAGKYYFCDASCELAGSWTATSVSGTANTSTGYHKLLLNTSNNPRVLFNSGGVVTVAQCDAGCNLTGNWSLQSPVPTVTHGNNMVRGDIDTSDILHFSHFGNESGFSGTLYYTSQFQRLGIVSVSPSQNALGVSGSSDVVVVFDDSLNTATVNSTNLPVYGSYTGLIDGVYTFSTTTVSNDTVTFNPTNDFKYGEHVKVVVSYNVQSPSAAPAVPYTTEFYVENVLGDGTFLPRVDYSASGQPTDIEVGDLDNDGDLDIATSNGNFGAPNLGVFMNNGDGTFAPVVLYSSGLNPRFISLGDLNNDGFLDAVLSAQNSSQMSVFMNNGDGTFAVAVGYSVGASTGDTDIGDVDMDGDNDIVVISVGASDTARVFFNNGSGVFGASTNYTATSDPYGIVLGDFDNDGDQDMVVSTINGANVLSRYSNNGNGTFAAKVDTSSTGNSEFVTSGDYDGDGNLDIALTLGSNNQFSVFIGNGDGTFDTPVNYTAESVTSGINNADVDADGDLDIIVTNRNSGSVSVFLNNGSGVLALSQHYPVIGASSTAGIATGDLNGDGAADMAVAGQNGGQISVLMGNVPNSVPTAPTTLYSNDTTAQAGQTNPSGLTDTTPSFSAICNDSDSGDILNKYRVQVDDQNDFSSVIWDSGAAGIVMADCIAGARSGDIVFAGTPLVLDGAVYYWRVKFWDDSGAEGAFSETVSTNTFTMSVPSSIQRLQSQSVAAPVAGQPEALDHATIRWYFTDQANNETGFKLLDDQGTVLKTFETTNISFIDETGLQANTEYGGRVVKAFNSATESVAFQTFSAVITPMPLVSPVVISTTPTTLTVGVSTDLPNLEAGDSGILFELLDEATGSARASAILSSGWIKQPTYTFSDLIDGRIYLIRAQARNQSSVPTTWSPYAQVSTVPITPQPGQPSFTLFFHLRDAAGQPVTGGLIDPSQVLHGNIVIKNTGTAAAHNVFATMPLPKFTLFDQGTLRVESRMQTAAADEDIAQASTGAVSAIWASVQPGETRSMNFDLTFDTAALRSLPASANPVAHFQSSLSYQESLIILTSTVIALELDLAQLIVVEPEPSPEEAAPVAEPTMEETQAIDAIIPQTTETPASGGTAFSPADTSVSQGDGSFNLDVTGSALSVTGMAFISESTLQFSGTTSEPNTLVTLIFNDSITMIVVSDADGNWQTFVSADQLGLQPGQTLAIKVEAIAAKGEILSERVTVGEFQLGRNVSGELRADFETVAAETMLTAFVGQARQQAIRFAREQEQPIQSALGVAAPVVVIASASIWGYLPYLPVMLYHAVSWLVGLAGAGKKRQRFYGVIYDSISKEPVALAIIRIRDQQGKLIATRVSDAQGRYETLLDIGAYTLEVRKPGYQFPSQVVTGMQDANFEHVYRPETGVQGEHDWLPDVPVDPINTHQQWQVAGALKKAVLVFRKAGNILALPVLGVGTAASAFLTIALPQHGINLALTLLYLGLFVLQIAVRPRALRAWGVVFDTMNKAVLPLVTLQLIDEQGRIVASRLSDYEGRYRFLPDPGAYHLKANKPGYVQGASDQESAGARLVINQPEQHIASDIGLRPLS